MSIEEAIEMLTEVSGAVGIGPRTEFGVLRLDSLTLIEWVSMIEEKLGADLDIRDLDVQELSGLSISDVLDVLRKRVMSA